MDSYDPFLSVLFNILSLQPRIDLDAVLEPIGWVAFPWHGGGKNKLLNLMPCDVKCSSSSIMFPPIT